MIDEIELPTVNDHDATERDSNGPLFLQGDLDIEGAAGNIPGLRFRAALCRCGQSKYIPYCE